VVIASFKPNYEYFSFTGSATVSSQMKGDGPGILKKMMVKIA